MKPEKSKNDITDCDDFPSPISQVPFWERMYEVSMVREDYFPNPTLPQLTFHIPKGANDIANSEIPM